MKIFERGELQNRMIRNMRARTSEITYYGPGPVRAFLYALAVEVQHLYYRLFRADLKQDPLRALGSDLDEVGAGRGVTRLGASTASAVLEFVGTIGTIIPVNFQVKSPTGVIYQTTESGTIAGSTLNSSVNGLKKLVAQSINTGAVAAVQQNSLTTMVNAANVTGGTLVSVTNPSASVGGADVETDEQYRGRIVKFLASLNQGTRSFYEAQVRSIDPTVVRTYVSKGTGYHAISVYVASRSGAAYTTPQLGAIATGLGPVTPVQTAVTVLNVTYTPIVLSFSGTIKTGFVLSSILDSITRNLNQYLDWSVWDWGTTVQWDDLLAIISNTPGVDNISFFTPFADIPVLPNSLPKLTSIAFTDITSQITTIAATTTEFPRL